jgi:hypothetical protein
MNPRTKTSIAIIGSGLSSAILVKRLAEVADVTVFERGGALPQKPHHIETGRPLGLSPSYGHGFGGTTNYWVGGMLRLRSGEMSSNWPAGMHKALADREKEAIACLYGQEIAEDFARDVPSAEDRDIFIDYILRPPEPFRASRSGYFDNVHLKLQHKVVATRFDQATIGPRRATEDRLAASTMPALTPDRDQSRQEQHAPRPNIHAACTIHSRQCPARRE